MAQYLELEIKGLNTNPSPFGTKGGTLATALNININQPNTASSRRGFKKYGDQIILSGSNRFSKFYSFKDSILVHYGDELYLDSDDAGTWSAYPEDMEPADDTIGMSSIQNNGSIFFCTNGGVKKLDSKAGTIIAAGVPKAIGADWALATNSTWFTNDNQVAYRVVWGYTDANSIVTLGTPSERIEVINSSGGNKSVDLTIYIPDGITTSYFYQVYRSSLSSGATIVANDELQLVYELFPTSAEIASGSISLSDVTPETLKGATIYTAATQEGIAQANEPPPLAKDVTFYKNVALYANTKTRHRKYLTLLGVGGDEGIGIADIITIGGVSFTGAAAQDHTVGEFLIDTSGTAAENIANTAKSLAQVINRYVNNTVTYAYYVSGYDQLPGKILIERRNLADTSFNISFTNGSTDDHSEAWNPVLTSAITSDNEEKTNRIYISKFNQIDVVPLVNFLDVGSGSSEIRRVIALRDSVFIFKDDGEVYRLVGEEINTFAVSLFDNTTKIISPKTAVPFNNQIFTFSDQGIVAVSDTGVAIKSWDIQDLLETYYDNSTFDQNGFAVNYDSDNKYIISLGIECLVYNSLTNSWTKWDQNREAAFVNPADDKLYWGDNDGYVYQERKDFTKFDFADDAFDVTVVSADSYNVTLTSLTNVEVGMTLRQGSRSAYITEFATDNVVTVDEIQIWVAGAATVNESIDCQLKWLPIYTENPGVMKRFREMTIMFRDMNEQFSIITSSNFDTTTEVTATISPSFSGVGWGSFAWGDEPWGGATSGSQEVRSYFPLTQQRALWANVKIRTQRAFTEFTLNAISVQFDQASERFRK